jgi:hypothetical protein
MTRLFALHGRMWWSVSVLLFSLSCEPWREVKTPQPADSLAALGKIRVTKLNDREVILTDAVVTGNKIRGMSDAITPSAISVPLDSVRKVEKERGKASEGLLAYERYLGVIGLITIAVGLAIYH